jgi:hypothetical protein
MKILRPFPEQEQWLLEHGYRWCPMSALYGAELANLGYLQEIC